MVRVGMVEDEFVKLMAQRLPDEKPLVKISWIVKFAPFKSMVEGEVVKYARLPLVHAAPVPPADDAQFVAAPQPVCTADPIFVGADSLRRAKRYRSGEEKT